jgi:hypothetical protein
MEIAELFDFLTKEHSFSYSHQEFDNCYGGHWIVHTYSFYNSNGCFTIYCMPERNELDFYVSDKFSTSREELLDKIVDISTIEPEIWKKRTKFLGISRPFFWINTNKVLRVFAEALKTHLDKNKDFFGIQV